MITTACKPSPDCPYCLQGLKRYRVVKDGPERLEHNVPSIGIVACADQTPPP